jgi:hypothetical protein
MVGLSDNRILSLTRFEHELNLGDDIKRTTFGRNFRAKGARWYGGGASRKSRFEFDLGCLRTTWLQMQLERGRKALVTYFGIGRFTDGSEIFAERCRPQFIGG